MQTLLLRVAFVATLLASFVSAQGSGFQRALKSAESALERGDLDKAGVESMRALGETRVVRHDHHRDQGERCGDHQLDQREAGLASHVPHRSLSTSMVEMATVG